MSLPYIIDFTDPLKASFSIPQSGFNGPGGTQSNTTMRLYGRGALEWGEAINEDLVRLTENFSGATAPLNPIDGQLWRQVKLYWHNTSAGSTAGWYSYNQTTHDWELIGGTGVIASTSASPTIGKYYYDSGTSTLYMYDSRYKQAAAAWFSRAFMSGAGVPGTTVPETTMYVYSEGEQAWKFLNTSVANNAEPAGSSTSVGQLWYDTADGKLKVWSGTAWVPVATTGSGTSWGGGTITGLAPQTYPLPDSNDAATINYVNDGLAAAVSNSTLSTLASMGSGIVVKTGPATYVPRTLAAGTGILITNPAGAAGNPAVAVDTSVIATKAFVTSSVAAAGTITVEPVSAGVPSNDIGNNGDIRYQY